MAAQCEVAGKTAERDFALGQEILQKEALLSCPWWSGEGAEHCEAGLDDLVSPFETMEEETFLGEQTFDGAAGQEEGVAKDCLM